MDTTPPAASPALSIVNLLAHVLADPTILGMVGFALWEAWLGATKRIAANSTLGLLLSVLRGIAGAVAGAARKSPGGPALVLVVFVALAPGCKASPQVVALTTTIATVDSLGAGVEAYTAAANTAEAKIAADVLQVCIFGRQPQPTRAEARACVDREIPPRRAAWDKADKAVAGYAAAVKLGAVGADVVKQVLDVLAGVGIIVNGGK